MDNDLAVFTVAMSAILLIALKKRKTVKNKTKNKRRIWVRSWVARRSERGFHNTLLEELRQEDKKSYKIYLRMDEVVFNYILSKVTPVISKQETHFRCPISAKDRLLVTLKYLATGESFSSLQFLTRIPQCTLSVVIPETCRAIYKAFKDIHLKVPNTETEWKEVSEDFKNKWHVFNCLGALDGKHVRITCPPNSGSHFYNYKLYNSIVLLALADANYKFLYVDVGTNGRVGDSGVYAKSKLRQFLNNRSLLNIPQGKPLPGTSRVLPYVAIADDAFPLSYTIMKPYPLRNLTQEEAVFNYRLSRGRRVVESAFGILSTRFRVLLNSINLTVNNVKDIVLACCILHNILVDKRKHFYTTQPRFEGDSIFQKRNEADIIMEELTPIARQDRQSLLHGAEIRNYFRDYYNGIGRVPWQEGKISTRTH